MSWLLSRYADDPGLVIIVFVVTFGVCFSIGAFALLRNKQVDTSQIDAATLRNDNEVKRRKWRRTIQELQRGVDEVKRIWDDTPPNEWIQIPEDLFGVKARQTDSVMYTMETHLVLLAKEFPAVKRFSELGIVQEPAETLGRRRILSDMIHIQSIIDEVKAELQIEDSSN